ncbi:unnamed protein product [Amoebophrya sp. A120]|nr:unnamed protein product [Amoebophrya sp. A120]|eukprot:GSA120T00009485001.1
MFLGTPLKTLDIEQLDERGVSNKQLALKQNQVQVRRPDGNIAKARGENVFHGAFTGGFSAGYFNTVDTKDGWVGPKSFTSKRERPGEQSSASGTTSRGGKNNFQQNVSDFLDEEDLQAGIQAVPQVKGTTLGSSASTSSERTGDFMRNFVVPDGGGTRSGGAASSSATGAPAHQQISPHEDFAVLARLRQTASSATQVDDEHVLQKLLEGIGFYDASSSSSSSVPATLVPARPEYTRPASKQQKDQVVEGDDVDAATSVAAPTFSTSSSATNKRGAAAVFGGKKFGSGASSSSVVLPGGASSSKKVHLNYDDSEEENSDEEDVAAPRTSMSKPLAKSKPVPKMKAGVSVKAQIPKQNPMLPPPIFGGRKGKVAAPRGTSSPVAAQAEDSDEDHAPEAAPNTSGGTSAIKPVLPAKAPKQAILEQQAAQARLAKKKKKSDFVPSDSRLLDMFLSPKFDTKGLGYKGELLSANTTAMALQLLDASGVSVSHAGGGSLADRENKQSSSSRLAVISARDSQFETTPWSTKNSTANIKGKKGGATSSAKGDHQSGKNAKGKVGTGGKSSTRLHSIMADDEEGNDIFDEDMSKYNTILELEEEGLEKYGPYGTNTMKKIITRHDEDNDSVSNQQKIEFEQQQQLEDLKKKKKRNHNLPGQGMNFVDGGLLDFKVELDELLLKFNITTVTKADIPKDYDPYRNRKRLMESFIEHPAVTALRKYFEEERQKRLKQNETENYKPVLGVIEREQLLGGGRSKDLQKEQATTAQKGKGKELQGNNSTNTVGAMWGQNLDEQQAALDKMRMMFATSGNTAKFVSTGSTGAHNSLHQDNSQQPLSIMQPQAALTVQQQQTNTLLASESDLIEVEQEEIRKNFRFTRFCSIMENRVKLDPKKYKTIGQLLEKEYTKPEIEKFTQVWQLSATRRGFRFKYNFKLDKEALKKLGLRDPFDFKTNAGARVFVENRPDTERRRMFTAGAKAIVGGAGNSVTGTGVGGNMKGGPGAGKKGGGKQGTGDKNGTGNTSTGEQSQQPEQASRSLMSLLSSAGSADAGTTTAAGVGAAQGLALGAAGLSSQEAMANTMVQMNAQMLQFLQQFSLQRPPEEIVNQI